MLTQTEKNLLKEKGLQATLECEKDLAQLSTALDKYIEHRIQRKNLIIHHLSEIRRCINALADPQFYEDSCKD